MGIFDSVMKATSSAAKYLLEETEEEKQAKLEARREEALQKRLDTLRNPMRSYMKKGEISESELNILISTASKLGIDTDDFKQRFEMVLSAKKEYYEGIGNGLFSKKRPDLFFYPEDEIEDYFEMQMGLRADTTLGELSLMKKTEEEMRRPHFDSAFNDAFPVVILNESIQDVQPRQQSSMVPPPAPTTVEYTLNVNGQNQGPYNMQQLQQMAQNGQLTRQTYVWKQGMANWEIAGNVQELASLFGTMPPPPPTTPPTPPIV